MENRISAFRTRLSENNLDLFIVSWPENRFYLSGFSARDTALNELSGFLCIDAQRLILFTDGRYVFQAREEAPLYDVRLYAAAPVKVMAQAIRETGARRVGIESRHLIVDLYRRFVEELEGIEVVPCEAMAEPLREIKQEEEIEAIQKAVVCTEQALARTVTSLKPGITEREAAWRIEKAIRENGAEDVSFTLIVAAGPNAAKAHHEPSERLLGEAEPIVIDIGALLGGYCSDMTRTIIFGDPPDKLKEIYSLVRRAQLNAIRNIKPGMTTVEADALARDVIKEAGYGEHFLHSLGHGVGLAVHESPSLRTANPVVLKENMVFTVEPGIYLEGYGGVRLEDIVVMRADGVQVLNEDSLYYTFDGQ